MQLVLYYLYKKKITVEDDGISIATSTKKKIKETHKMNRSRKKETKREKKIRAMNRKREDIKSSTTKSYSDSDDSDSIILDKLESVKI